MREQYITKRPQANMLNLISQIQHITEEYMSNGYSLSVRQIFYQLVSRDLIANTEKDYQNVIRACTTGRLMGAIDWSVIVDRTRSRNYLPNWSSPEKLMRAAAKQYHRDWWENQPYYLECWVEKEALADVVYTAASAYDVSGFACKGYSSLTSMYDTAGRMKDHAEKQCIILYLGDHDPSGMDMYDNIKKQMSTFNAVVDVVWIALSMEQIEQYNPPPNPAKQNDTRYKKYAEVYGAHSWELDALPPDVISKLITDNILLRLDKELLAETQASEEHERLTIMGYAKI